MGSCIGCSNRRKKMYVNKDEKKDEDGEDSKSGGSKQGPDDVNTTDKDDSKVGASVDSKKGNSAAEEIVNNEEKKDEGGEGRMKGSKRALDGADTTDKEDNKDDESVDSEKNDEAAEEAQKFVKSPDEGAVVGLALLDEELFLLQMSSTAEGHIDTIEVFDASSLDWKRRMPVELTESMDMTSSSEHKLLFVSATRDGFIYVINPTDDSVRHWSLDNDKPVGLSVSPTTNNLLVTSFNADVLQRSKIIEVTFEGERVRQIELQVGIENPWHAVQLESGQFVVCHGNKEDRMHRICLVNEEGYIEKKFGGRRMMATESEETTGVSVPWHVAADEDGFVLVADSTNNRVLLLTPEMKFDSVYAKGLPDTLPCRLCLDAPGKRMYVASNKYKDERLQLGQIAVYVYGRSSETSAHRTNWLTKTAAVSFKK